ncbi:NAD(P)-binding protein [Aspergillus taichungensis]|uniref:NAD(P)-binding protein n=1 Tax=Aspergillus taichungensis TaxID=482145 RepID=A0A2J5I5R2_9EURO|nr:NAD(P)-binding protein [Aspergillus taichungensis]
MSVQEAPIFPVLEGKVAIVTGAAQGMGKATASVFVRAGAKVVIADVKAEEGARVAKELSELGEVRFVQTDISKSEDVQKLVAETVSAFGKLDVAINNAAMTPDKTALLEFDEDYWGRLMDVNLTGTALCCKYQMQQMKKQGHGGSIVNIASINAYSPQPNMPAYTAAKHALLGLTKHAATEGGPSGIRVNAIAPGAIFSEMSAKALEIMGTTHDEFAPKVSSLNRFGQAHEVAHGSLWLASAARGLSTIPCSHIVPLPLTFPSLGIGSAIVRNLASKGSNVVINYATEGSDAAAAALAAELEQAYSIRALPLRADITSRSECERLVSRAKKHFRHPHTDAFQIDIIVHNAAIVYVGPVETVDEKEFQRIYEVNVLGPILLTGACKPYLPTDRSGRIVMLSSINSKVGTAYTTLYAGTKGAVEAMTRVWCRELAERATVNSINPGPVMTDMYLKASDEIKQSLALWNPLTPLVPVRDTDSPEVRALGEKFGGRAAYAEEIAGLVATICNPEFGWCTGSIISANGGLSFSV